MSDEPLTPAEEYCKRMRMRFPTAYLSDLAVVLRLLYTSIYDYKWVDGQLVETAPEDGPYRLTEEGWKSFRNLNNSRPPTKWDSPHRGSALFAIPDDAAEHWLDFIDGELSYVTDWDKVKIHAWIDAYYEFQLGNVAQRMSQIRDSQESFNLVQDAAEAIRKRIRFIHDMRNAKLYPPQKKIEEGSDVRSQTGVVYATVMEITKVVGEFTIPMARLSPPLKHPLQEKPQEWWALSSLVLKDEPCLADCA